jgi:hypothetical protein
MTVTRCHALIRSLILALAVGVALTVTATANASTQSAAAFAWTDLNPPGDTSLIAGASPAPRAAG